MSDNPQPHVCTYCGHVYLTICDGKSGRPNRVWLDERRKETEAKSVEDTEVKTEEEKV